MIMELRSNNNHVEVGRRHPASTPARDMDEGCMQRPQFLSVAEKVYSARRERERLLGSDLFADPAWDILLHLFIASLERRPVTVSKACHASAAPATTALRFIATLENAGLIARRQHPHDRRSSTLELTADGDGKMRAFFEIADFGAADTPVGPAWFHVPPPAIVNERIVFRR